MNENDIATSTPTDGASAAAAPGRRLGKRGWIAIGVSAAVLVGVAAVAVPAAVNAFQLSSSQAAYAAAADHLNAARAENMNAQKAENDRAHTAAAQYDVFRKVSSALPGGLVDPASARATFVTASSAFAKAAGLTVDKTGKVTVVPVDAKYIVESAPKVADSKDKVDAQTKGVLLGASAAAAQTKLTSSTTLTIDARFVDATNALDSLVSAAAKKGKSLAYPKASTATKSALKAAVAGLVVKDAKGVALAPAQELAAIQRYSAAVRGASASQAAAIAAAKKKAAAEQKARAQQSSGSNTGAGGYTVGGSSGGYSSNTGGGYSSGGYSNGGSTSRGSSGGGSTGGSSSGGSTSGGTSSGGSTGGTKSNWQPAKVTPIAYACTSSSARSQSASYGSTIHYPSDAASHSVSDTGTGWIVTWECDYGF